MGAINVATGKTEFLGQVVTSDLEESHHDPMLFGEIYFIWYELEGYNRIQQPRFKFHKQYCNVLEYMDAVTNTWVEDTPRQFRYYHERRLKSKYVGFVCDAPEYIRMDFNKFKDAELLFSQTIRNFQRATALRKEANCTLIGGINKGMNGWIQEIRGNRIFIMSLDGEDTWTSPNNVVLTNPRDFLEGRCGCIDCHCERIAKEMLWIDEYGRPMCIYCYDQYLDRGIELTQNITGPFNYEHDSTITYLGDDAILRNMHGVLLSEGRS